jgi:hypothetical protein
MIKLIYGKFGKRSLDRISLDRNCHFSLDRNCHFSLDRNFTNHLIELFDSFHLIESLNNEFGQTPKNQSLDRIIRSSAK